MAKQATSKKESPSQQPLFFKNPAPVMKDKHAEAGLSGKIDYGFSKTTNSVPLTIREFGEACKAFPIVFSNNEAVAVLGLENTKNLYVTQDGKWQKDSYIPAYIRKYPFAFMSMGQGAEEKLILCVDEASERFVKKARKSDTKFFEAGQETKSTRNALEYCLQFHRDTTGTAEFVKAISEAEILVPKQITATFKNKAKPINLTGFTIIDEKKLRELPAAKITEWHQNGFLSLIYMHLISLSNFNKLSSLVK